MLLKPQLFISYSTKDAAFAEALNTAIVKNGYKTFFDKESIEAGEVFPKKIIDSIKRCDGCIIIVSLNSIKSEWCKLEAYYASFYKKLIIPIKKGSGDYDVDSPLRHIQKDIHYVVTDDNDNNVARVIVKIQRGLKAAENKARIRLLKLTGIVVGFVLFLVALFTLGVNGINHLAYEKARNNFVKEVKNSDKIFRTKEIELYKNKFNNDQELSATLHLMEIDPGVSDIARINSKIMAAAVLQSFNLTQRQFYNNIDWKNSTMDNNQFTNSTFASGNISQVNFNNIQFADVNFNGVDAKEQGVQMSGDRFINCGFNTVYLDKNNAIDLKFYNCRFKGSFLNTTEFGAVVFASDTTSDLAVITNGQVTFFDNCIFENDNEPDEPGVMVLGKEEEMQFKNIVFDKCRFIGLVRPEWFINCSFYDCIFPKDVDEKLLEHQ